MSATPKLSPKAKEAEELLKKLIPKIAILGNSKLFYKQHGFTLAEYVHNRNLFATTCDQHASHMHRACCS